MRERVLLCALCRIWVLGSLNCVTLTHNALIVEVHFSARELSTS